MRPIAIAQLARRAFRASPGELRVRGTQRFMALAESLGFVPDATDTASTSLPALLRMPNGDPASAPPFFAAFTDRAATIAALRRSWPEREARAVADAERSASGTFDLLGYRDLAFGAPIDWHLDPVAGRRSPRIHWSRIDYLDPAIVGDHKVVWELNRHHHFLILGKAYWYTGDERYASIFVEQIDHWMRENDRKRSVNWASSLEVAFRAISWIWALHFFRSSPTVGAGTRARIAAVLRMHGRHIARYLSTYFSPNTHLTGEALALLYLGLMLPELDTGGEWRRAGMRILTDELQRQVSDAGVYFEQSTHYQRYTADFYLHFSILAAAHGIPVPSSVHARGTAALDYLVHLQRPDGLLPLIGDDDGGCVVPYAGRAPNDCRPTLATAAALRGRGDYRFAAGDLAEEVLWLLGPSGLARFSEIEPVPPASRARRFLGGHVVMRDAWSADANYVAFDCGAHGGGAHPHADALSVEIVASGIPMLVDPGTYTYTTEPALREQFRLSAAHNVVTIGAEPAATPAGPFGWARVPRTTVEDEVFGERFGFVRAAHDGYRDHPLGPVHERSVLFRERAYWVLRDRIVPVPDAPVVAHFHFAADLTVERAGSHGVTARGRGASGALVAHLATFGEGGRCTATIEHGIVSPGYGAREEAAVLRVTSPGSSPVDLVTFIVPARGEARSRVSELPAIRGRLFAIDTQGGRDLVAIGDGAIDGGGIEAEADWAWVRGVDAPDGFVAAEFIILGGRTLIVGGESLVALDARASAVTGRRVDDGWAIEPARAGTASREPRGSDRGRLAPARPIPAREVLAVGQGRS